MVQSQARLSDIFPPRGLRPAEIRFRNMPREAYGVALLFPGQKRKAA